MEWAGWAEAPDNEADFRRRLEAAVLLSELVGAVPGLADRFSGVLPAEPRRPAAAYLAGLWRGQETFREAYVRAARRVEAEYELGQLLTAEEALLGLETFPVVDDLWRREVVGAVAPTGATSARRPKASAGLPRAGWASSGPGRAGPPAGSPWPWPPGSTWAAGMPWLRPRSFRPRTGSSAATRPRMAGGGWTSGL